MSGPIENALSNLGEAADVVGFRYWLEKAIRIEGDSSEVDWSPHTIDYLMFKQTLKHMARRRAKIRQLLRDSQDGRISEQVLLGILGPPPPAAKIPLDITNTTLPEHNPLVDTVEMTHLGRTAEGTNYYVPFIDADASVSTSESQKSDTPPAGSSSGEGGAAPRAATSESPSGGGAAGAGDGNNNNNKTTTHTSSSKKLHKRRTKRSILRRISNLERTEMLSFLTWEMDKVQMFYLAQWQRLSLEMEKATTSRSRLSQIQQYTTKQSSQRQQSLSASSSSPLAPSSLPTGRMRRNEAHELSSAMLEEPDPVGGVAGTLNITLGDEILELLAFCVINCITARQILIRYDAYARTFEGTPMLNYYMKQVVKYPTSFRKVLYHEELKALADSYVEEMALHKASMAMIIHFQSQRLMFHDILHSTNSQQRAHPHDVHTHHYHHHQSCGGGTSMSSSLDPMIPLNLQIPYANLDSSTVPAPTTGSQQQQQRQQHYGQYRTSSMASMASMNSVMGLDGTLAGAPPADPAMTTTTMATASPPTAGAAAAAAATAADEMSPTDWKDYLIQTIRGWFLLSGGFEDRLGLEPAYLTMRGKSLTTEMQQLAEWRKKKHEILPSPTVMSEKKKELTGLQMYMLTLNLISALLYCMNYYIVEPSSTMYVNRLGAHDALSGTLIGMMPLAAFISSIPYSMWTNRSFRHPFIMSCVFLIFGNLIYSLADQVHRVEVALVGRFICGLGAPKCIIRRYMADTTPMSLRTSVNAGFGMVVAAGSAMGPAMAILLNKVEYTAPAIPYLGYVTLNGLTLPGYFMAALWFTFTVVVVTTFEEPDREGLEEQKQLESKNKRPTSPLTTAGSLDDTEASGKSGEALLSSTEKENNNVSQRAAATASPTAAIIESSSPMAHEEDLRTIFSGDSVGPLGHRSLHRSFSMDISQNSGPSFIPNDIPDMIHQHRRTVGWKGKVARHFINVQQFFELITLPVRICLGLLFAKVFTIEALVSSTSVLTKNRYHWQVQQVGTLGFVNGCLVIPFSIMVGKLSMSYQDHMLMRYLLGIGIFALFLLIDLTDLVATPTGDWNQNHPLAVGPKRYISGYFMAYLSIQAFEGVIGSTLSKVIPTALACGTFNSGLLATLVDTLGRSCGDMSISLAGLISLRQLMNLLFIPGFSIMLTCLVVIERHRDLLAV